MTPKEAIEELKYDCEQLGKAISCDTGHGLACNEAYAMAIWAIEKVQDYEAQWLNDINNPLEPLKLSKALDSEIFKLKYRMENEPEKINMLDYTIIAALQDCLNRYKGVMKNEV